MPIISSMNGTTQVLLPVTYREVPFYLSIWFYLGLIVMFASISFFIYQFIKYRQKNRLVVRIHNPDQTIEAYVYRNFSGQTFKIESHGEKTSTGELISYNYKFNPEALEIGTWGRYIDYDYGVVEPIIPKNRLNKDDNIPTIFRFFNSLIDTRLLTDLVLSNKWKDMISMMILFVLILAGINLAINIIMPLTVGAHPTCRLDGTNETVGVIVKSVKIAIGK